QTPRSIAAFAFRRPHEHLPKPATHPQPLHRHLPPRHGRLLRGLPAQWRRDRAVGGDGRGRTPTTGRRGAAAARGLAEMTGDAIERRLRNAVRTLDDPPALSTRSRIVVPGPPLSVRPAAVLVPFVPRDARLSVLFTRRNANLRNHAGQVSFPGGGIDATDAGPVAAALRETREETGIDEAQVDPFGYLDCLDTVSGYCVTPVTGFVRSDYALRLHEDEVDEVF